jgi:hypothetical protein
MNPIKLVFVKKIVNTEQGGSKFEGIKEINEMFKQGLNDSKGEDFLKYSMENLHEKMADRINEGFRRDFENTGMRFEKITYQIDNLGRGRTAIGKTGESLKYDVIATATSVVYTCIDMNPEKKIFTCHTGLNTELESFINSGPNPIVVG